jgi:uncharacterized protein
MRNHCFAAFGLLTAALLAAALLSAIASARAQVPPSATELAAYRGIQMAAAEGDYGAIASMASAGVDLELRDNSGRTPFLIATHRGQVKAMEALAKAGADVNALDEQAYDAVTIAAVADDLPAMKAALALGNKATNITSPYNGTALIAAAHLGHDEVVRTLIEAGAPLDHMNNLGWTALIEAVILGDGGTRHQKTVAHLVEAGADKDIADKNGVTALDHARQRGYAEIVKLLEG